MYFFVQSSPPIAKWSKVCTRTGSQCGAIHLCQLTASSKRLTRAPDVSHQLRRGILRPTSQLRKGPPAVLHHGCCAQASSYRYWCVKIVMRTPLTCAHDEFSCLPGLVTANIVDENECSVRSHRLVLACGASQQYYRNHRNPIYYPRFRCGAAKLHTF